jgi:predicted GNAT family acetyltransferase
MLITLIVCAEGCQTMSATVSQPVVRHNFDSSRFDVYVDGKNVGQLLYEMHQGEMWLLGTVVEHQYEKTGVGQALICAALEDAHRRRLAVVPFCRLTRAFLNSAPLYLDLVPPAQRERFKLSPAQSISARRKRGMKEQLAETRATGGARRHESDGLARMARLARTT